MSVLDSGIYKCKEIPPNHKILSKGKLRKSKGSGHPRAEFRITLAKPRRGGVQPDAVVRGVVDSGAMSNLWSLKDFIECGFTRDDLVSVKMDMRAANKNPINILGALNARLVGKSPSGEILYSDTLIYISDSVKDFSCHLIVCRIYVS